MKAFVILMMVLLAVFHQDFWWWNEPYPVFGFIPVGLAWHAGISLVAGLLGLLAVNFCWPASLDAEDASLDAQEAAEPREG